MFQAQATNFFVQKSHFYQAEAGTIQQITFTNDEVSVQIEQFLLFTSVLQFCMSSRDHIEKFT